MSPAAPKAEKISLELLAGHRPDSLVAFGGAGTKTAADLLADAARISRALPPAFPNSHVLLVFEHDRYAMAVSLLGALDRGHAVALPPSSRHDSILAIREQPETAIVIHDTDAGLPITFSELMAAASKGSEEADGGPVLESPIVPHAGVIATVFTSGTMGPMTRWQKTSAELLGEASVLGTTFAVEPGAKIVGAVSPGHIYGLLFTILLPLMRGASFSRDTPHHAEAIAHCVGENEANILVSVPVQLRALGVLPAGSLSSLGRVFSSTGPLPEAVANSFSTRFGLPVTEIFGSTETGGIAWRRRQAGQAPTWQPLDGVEIAIGDDGKLVVDSPFVHADLPRPFETADLIELHEDGGFIHLGRADGIVKIGGRRVSIPEVETCIRQQSDIEEVAVVAVPVEGGRGHQLLAAVVPNSRDVVDLAGKIREALRKKFEPTCLPRRIVVVDAIPKEANGKIPRDRLLRLFDLQADGQPVNWTLEWGEPVSGREGDRESLEIPVRIPEDYAWFEGHFEDYPVLAGAVQLKELILPTVSRAFPKLGSVLTMSRIKFSGRIIPGDRVVVRVERGARLARVQFEIRKRGDGSDRGDRSSEKDGERCARGVLVLAEGSQP
jgi:acyl-coenzyme A synthetase/AMP-(fatty) acid ligase